MEQGKRRQVQRAKVTGNSKSLIDFEKQKIKDKMIIE